MTYENERTKIDEIVTAQARFEQQTRKVEDEKNILKLLENDLVNRIRSIYTKYDLINKVFVLAQEQLVTSVKNKPDLSQLEELISKDFVGEKIKIKDIYSCGMENYAWRVDFYYKGIKFMIRIPIHMNINKNNYEYASYGKYVLECEKDEYEINVFCQSYFDEDIKQAIQDEVEREE